MSCMWSFLDSGRYVMAWSVIACSALAPPGGYIYVWGVPAGLAVETGESEISSRDHPCMRTVGISTPCTLNIIACAGIQVLCSRGSPLNGRAISFDADFYDESL